MAAPRRLELAAPASVFPVQWLRYFPSDVARTHPPRLAHTHPLQLLQSLSDFPYPAGTPATGRGILNSTHLAPYDPAQANQQAALDVAAAAALELAHTAAMERHLRMPSPLPLHHRHGPHLPHLPQRTPSPAASRGTLSLTRFLYSGHVWDVYAAHLGHMCVLAKLTDLASFERAERPHVHALLERELRFARETSRRRPPGSQGLVGMYGSLQPDGTQLLVLLFEGSRELTRIERHEGIYDRQITEAYAHLHGQGIAHHNVGWRGIRLNRDDGIVLFDFEHATEGDDEGTRAAEMAAVRDLIRWK